MIEVIILILSVLGNVLVGLLVFLKNPKSITNRLFALLTFGLSSWAIVNYLSVHVDTGQLFLMRLTMFFVILMNSAFFFLVRAFPHGKFVFSPRAKVFAVYCILTALIALSPLLFTSLKTEGQGVVSPQPGPGMLFFMIHATICIVGAPIYLARKYQRSKATERMQLKFFLIGTSVMFTLLPVTNFVLPLAFEFSELVLLGPLYTVIFAGLIGYAIVRHRLFDIKWFVAKAVAYILLIATLVGVYVALVFGLTTRFIEEDSTFSQQVLPILAALFVSATAPFFKKLFDRITNRFFYRDAYDPQVFLDRLNKTLVGNIELGILLRQTTEVIQDNLKCEVCLIGVRETDTTPFRIIGSTGPSFKVIDMQFVSKELAGIGQKIVITDELPPSRDKLKQLLQDDNIAIICSLSSSATHELATAYLILGHKKSGNVYSKQDLKLIEIISDELVIAIQNALRFEEIQGFAITLQNKVNEATAKLRHTNAKLKEMDETKDEFISMASHQLRTPLTSVKGYLSMVLDGDAGKLSNQQKELLNQAFVSSQRMVYLIADLLNVSRLKTGKFVIDAEPTNLAKMAESELAQLSEAAKAKDITLDLVKPDDFPDLMLDETKTRQVVMNFVDNAIYYTPSGGTVTIELRDDKNRVYFMVKDDGIGVPKSEQEHLFTKFYRAKNARKARPDGTGLGLFMAKKVIAAQGGDTLFESREGKGSMFGFSFDKTKLQAPQSSTGANKDNGAK